MNFVVRAVPAGRVRALGRHRAPERAGTRRARATRRLRSRAKRRARSLSGRRSDAVRCDRDPAASARSGPRVPGAEARGSSAGGALKMFGKLTWDAIPGTSRSRSSPARRRRWSSSACSSGSLLKGYLPYLWREWITSVDHKRIGVMYCLLGAVMLLRGFIDAIMMRSQQAIAFHAPATFRPSTTTRSSPRMARS